MVDLSRLTREDVLKAIADYDNEIMHPFGGSRSWILLYEGEEYPPKAIAGIACRHAYGRMPGRHNELHGGEQPGYANPILRKLGFTVVPKREVPPESRLIRNNRQPTPTRAKLKRTNEVPEAVDLSDPPNRKNFTVSRVVRDSVLVQRIKAQHEHQCQLCDTVLMLTGEQRYSEAHHLQPLGGMHRGPDIAENIVIVCPNHHALLDFGAIRLDTKSIRRRDCHGPSTEFIKYHNKHVFRPK